MTADIETSTAASSCAFSFSSSRFCARLRSLFFDFSAATLFLLTATSCFACPLLEPLVWASHGLTSAVGAGTARCEMEGESGGDAESSVGGRSVDFSVTLEVSEASEPTGRTPVCCGSRGGQRDEWRGMLKDSPMHRVGTRHDHLYVARPHLALPRRPA